MHKNIFRLIAFLLAIESSASIGHGDTLNSDKGKNLQIFGKVPSLNQVAAHPNSGQLLSSLIEELRQEGGPSESPWYKKADLELKTDDGSTHRIKYDITNLLPDKRIFHAPFALGEESKDPLLKYSTSDKGYKEFFELFGLQEFYGIDINGDKKIDVWHIVDHMPQRYLTDEFTEILADAIRSMGGAKKENIYQVIFQFCREYPQRATLKKTEKEVVVNIEIDLPPYDGKPDILVQDSANPSSAFGGDGKADRIMKMQGEPFSFDQKNKLYLPDSPPSRTI